MNSYFCKMKLFARLLLVLFLAFLSTPTVVALIEKNADTSLFYSFAEEEIQKDFKEIKADLNQEVVFVLKHFPIEKKSKIISENLSRHDNVADEIFSPPPELV